MIAFNSSDVKVFVALPLLTMSAKLIDFFDFGCEIVESRTRSSPAGTPIAAAAASVRAIRPAAPALLYWFEARKKDGVVTFTPHVIDDDSGVGTQFFVGDVNGDKLPDVVISNKKGTFQFEQVRQKK